MVDARPTTTARAGAILRGPVVVGPLAAAAAVVLIVPMTRLELLVAANIALAVVLLLIPPRGLGVAKTWVVAYLLIQFPGRALFLLSHPVERPPIYRLYLPGVQEDAALRQALEQVLLGLAIVAVAYVLVVHVRPRPVQQPEAEARVRTGRFYAVMLPALAMLLFLPDTNASSFIASLPGLCAAGAGCYVAYAFTRHPRQYLIPLLIVLTYGVARVTILHSKLALLAAMVGLAVGASVRMRSYRFGAVAGALVPAATVVVALLVFSAAIPAADSGGEAGVGAAVDRGAAAVVSRSYGVDSLMAVNSHLALGGQQIHGASFVEIVYSPVPRALWPEKPVSYSMRFGETIFYFSPLAGESFFAPSYPGEWLINFGWLGLLLGWLLLGLFVGAIDCIRSVPHRVLWLAVSAHAIEGSLVAQFWLAVPFLFGGYLVAQHRQRRDPR